MPWFFPERELDSFESEKARLNLCESHDLGVMPVEVTRIIGSVGRWRDFDAKFRLTNQATRQRLRVIKDKMADGFPFPPVHLYKVHDHYYVADGNHRVAAAKDLGMAFVDAQIQEYFPCDDRKDSIYWRERSAFENMTECTVYSFTNPDTYRRLLTHLSAFQTLESTRLGYELGLPHVTQIWLSDVDAPIRSIVRKEGLKERFAGRTEDDLVFYVIYHYVGLLRAIKGPENVAYREAVARLLAAPGRTLMGRLRRFVRQIESSTRRLFDGETEIEM